MSPFRVMSREYLLLVSCQEKEGHEYIKSGLGVVLCLLTLNGLTMAECCNTVIIILGLNS